MFFFCNTKVTWLQVLVSMTAVFATKLTLFSLSSYDILLHWYTNFKFLSREFIFCSPVDIFYDL